MTIKKHSSCYEALPRNKNSQMSENIVLPTTWILVNGRDYVSNEKSDIVDGPFGSNLKASEYIDQGIPVAKIQNVKRFQFIKNNIRFISEEKFNQLQRHSFKNGDILITKLGKPLGLACIVPEQFGKGIIVADLVRFRVNKKISSNTFIVYLINSENVINQISKHIKGTTRSRINLTVIRGLKLPLPPLAEQKEIATRLDKLLTQVDTLKTRLDTIPTLLKRFRQSVLVAAVSGKLTEDWRGNNNLIKINSKKLDMKKLGYVTNKEFYCDSPKGWTWTRLGGISKLINGDRGKNYPKKSEYVDNGIPFINTGHIEINGSLSTTKMNYISRKKFNSLSGGKIQCNDLVYCLRGATMGKTAIVNPLKEGCIASSLVIVRPKKSLFTKFAYYFLISPQGKDLILRFDNGSAQPNLSAKSLSLYPIALPTIKEQTEIVTRVESLFTFADKIEQQVTQAQDRINNLTQSILAKAFRGELTADWRKQYPELISGENSAEALLARIKAEQEKLATKPKRKRRSRQ